MRKLLWGRVCDMDAQVRIASLVFVVTMIVSMSFAQLGFWSIGAIEDTAVYLMFILAPVVMGGFIYGPITGSLIGLFAGAVVYAHATLIPLDLYEIYFMMPLNTFVTFTLVGALAGCLFKLIFKRRIAGASFAICVFVVCLGLSLLASALVQMNVFIIYAGLGGTESIRNSLLVSLAGFGVQALIDAVLMFALCMAANTAALKMEEKASERRLLSVFRNWMAFVSAIVFMLASGAIFTVETYNAQAKAAQSMQSEITYLQKQLNARQDGNYGNVLDGYMTEIDGWAIVVDENGIILASDDEDLMKPGHQVLDYLGEEGAEDEDGYLYFAIFAEEYGGEAAYLSKPSEPGVRTMDLAFAMVDRFDNGYVLTMQPFEMVYEERFGVMTASTILAVALLIAIGLVAMRLLDEGVLRRIDETNSSLEKITGGNLNERVNVRASREFTSLSEGINTTVGALKSSIAEVEQRNAQELATAKAIQESALPYDFPAFPEIDRFDIYASMKTAKEVGGDFYDFFEIEGSSRIGFVMADVSGKGIPAALFMMTAKTQIRTYMESGLPVNEAVDAANHQLCLGNEAGMFVTMLACELNYETGELTYVNAGHNPPLVLHGGQWSWMRDVSGMPLGLFDGIPYRLLSLQMAEGDMLYLYTDGVTEAIDANENLFGEERLEQTLYKYIEYNPRSVCVGIRRAITDFTLDCEQSDDITMLGLKYGVPPEEKAVMVLDANINQLVHVCNYIHAELHRRRAPKSVQNPLDIATEELFVNICNYAYPDATPENPGEVRISFEYDANPPSITVQMADDGIPYNPLAKPDAVTPDDIADVPIGGLGILMAKKSVDEMYYERVGESNVLTFKKVW